MCKASSVTCVGMPDAASKTLIAYATFKEKVPLLQTVRYKQACSSPCKESPPGTI